MFVLLGLFGLNDIASHLSTQLVCLQELNLLATYNKTCDAQVSDYFLELETALSLSNITI